ncbi:uncharacterized protein LOC111085263 [Limulus polyphemus]|uniref:Uncharacterized protein LOC111085263 n=1 Tax=Limulus polyphemus TaxID=6850 RepID=A0ABM1S514_LIMPO|nr:uncharacterized protein LOC111085263 [Limulus polyphemus]
MLAKETTFIIFTLILTCRYVTKDAEAYPEFWKSANYPSFLDVQEKNPQFTSRLPADFANKVALLLAGELPWQDKEPYGNGFVQRKRQIRYNQCYFNPISCFRKRK